MVFGNSSLMTALGVGDGRTLWPQRHVCASAKRRASFENAFTTASFPPLTFSRFAPLFLCTTFLKSFFSINLSQSVIFGLPRRNEIRRVAGGEAKHQATHCLNDRALQRWGKNLFTNPTTTTVSRSMNPRCSLCN